MNNFSSFVISFCVVSAVIGGFYIVFPNGKMSKSVKYIAVLSVMCAFLGLFCLGFNMKFDGNFDVSYDTTEINEELTKMVFESALKNAGIKYKKIIIFTDNTESDSITISRVVVYSDEVSEKIKKIIGNDGEYEVEVINE